MKGRVRKQFAFSNNGALCCLADIPAHAGGEALVAHFQRGGCGHRNDRYRHTTRAQNSHSAEAIENRLNTTQHSGEARSKRVFTISQSMRIRR